VINCGSWSYIDQDPQLINVSGGSGRVGRGVAIALAWRGGGPANESAEHLVEVGVSEHPIGVELVPDRDEVVETRIGRPQVLG
jgi:hypothetical protein